MEGGPSLDHHTLNCTQLSQSHHLHFLVQTPLEDDASTQLYGVFSIAESPEATQLYGHDGVSTFLEESGNEKNNNFGNEELDKELMEFELGSGQ